MTALEILKTIWDIFKAAIISFIPPVSSALSNFKDTVENIFNPIHDGILSTIIALSSITVGISAIRHLCNQYKSKH